MKTQTIAAISTALGDGAISIVRMSGEEATAILQKVCTFKSNKKIQSHKLRMGLIKKGDIVLDEVMVSVMLAPHTYTKEDVVEINCHGGITSARSILALLLDNGAVLAQPGEFTKRAFLNGRIDLTQAEAVIDIINSKSNVARNVAVNMLQGRLGKMVRGVRAEILHAVASLEVAIDYPDEGYFSGHDEVLNTIKNSIEKISEILDASKWDNILKNGIDTVILGKPNVGKSSLLNTLLQEERAIVTDIPGTTRDLITASLHINSIPINIIDTAGIRDTTDVIEKIGQERTFDKVDNADLVMLVIDGSKEISDEDIELIQKAKEKNLIIIINKIDLEEKLKSGHVEKYTDAPIIKISAKESIGIEKIDAAVSSFYPNADVTSELMIANMRHREYLLEAIESLEIAKKSMAQNQSEEFISLDLTNAYASLGAILGEEVDEDIIDKIFSEFCLGK